MKKYNVQYNIWKTKYAVNTYDGTSKNRDGSEAWGIVLFKNKKKLHEYTALLDRLWYTPTL
jgi:hypothetical protein